MHAYIYIYTYIYTHVHTVGRVKEHMSRGGIRWGSKLFSRLICHILACVGLDWQAFHGMGHFGVTVPEDVATSAGVNLYKSLVYLKLNPQFWRDFRILVI